jgi:hypothetical protein
MIFRCPRDDLTGTRVEGRMEHMLAAMGTLHRDFHPSVHGAAAFSGRLRSQYLPPLKMMLDPFR